VAVPPSIYENSCCSTSFSAFGVVRVPGFGHSSVPGCVVASYGVLIYISLMTYDVEHLLYAYLPCIYLVW